MNKIKFIALAASVALALAFTFSCDSGGGGDDGSGSGTSSGNGGVQGGSSSSVGGISSSSFVSCPVSLVSDNSVTCGGQTYKTVVIGEQVWFAENLNYNVSGSKCYNDDPSNCAKYGRLYSWTTAMKVCPSGWHLPSNAEWEAMMAYIDGAEGKKLKATSDWNYNGNGTDDYGFSALPGGRWYNSTYQSIGNYGYWWSSTEILSSSAHLWYMYYESEYVGLYNSFKGSSYGFSVRCLQDGSGNNGSGSSSSVGGVSSSSFVSCPVSLVSDNSVTCGGQTYKTVVIGEQVWFAENLNYKVEGSRCYDDDPSNCDIYGRLYNWDTAKKVCPEGWHLPSREEWSTLSSYVVGNDDCNSCAGTKLKATSGWNNFQGESGNGTDYYGFSALPGGDGSENGSFSFVGYQGNWWNSGEDNSYGLGLFSHFITIYSSRTSISQTGGPASKLLSVRCLKD